MHNLTPVIDLHCDLLSYLVENNNHSPLSEEARCSLPQLKKGKVALQTLAIFAPNTKGSTKLGEAQVSAFKSLLNNYPKDFVSYKKENINKAPEAIQIIASIENATVLAEEEEDIERALERLESYLQLLHNIFYISLTWDGENRFGGGAGTDIGLKDDGRVLLDFLSNKSIAVDLSHTSDALAYGILNHIDKKGLNVPVIASHSNFRKISNFPRNLPDELAKEIIRRKGLIGMNFFSAFISLQGPQYLFNHIEHGLKLGAYNNLCFGADFFCDAGFPMLKKKYNIDNCFYSEYGDASCYPNILNELKLKWGLSSEQIELLAYRNASNFLEKL